MVGRAHPTVGKLNGDASGAGERVGGGGFEEDVGNVGVFDYGGAVLFGVIEHHFVEFASHHLPGDGTFVGVHFVEIEGLRFAAGGGDELDGVFTDEIAGL